MKVTGRRGEYSWVEMEGGMAELLAACPGVVEGKYVAVTSLDSGCPFSLPEGWRVEGGIYYSPRIQTVEQLRPALDSGGCCGGHWMFPEAYVFDWPVSLSSLCLENVFEAGIGPARVFQFVTFCGFRLSATDSMSGVVDLLWDQIEWMRPAAYVAAGEGRAYLARRDEGAG